jgi:hypothetical protein
MTPGSGAVPGIVAPDDVPPSGADVFVAGAAGVAGVPLAEGAAGVDEEAFAGGELGADVCAGAAGAVVSATAETEKALTQRAVAKRKAEETFVIGTFTLSFRVQIRGSSLNVRRRAFTTVMAV